MLHLDDLYPGWDALAAGAARLADEALPAWRAGRAARLRRWDWDAGAWSGAGDDLVVAPGPLLVVEGVGAGAAELAPGDVLVWAQAPDEVRRHRALARDGEAYAPHWDRWAAQEEAHLRAHAPAARADVVVVTG
ncbi:hypothetical protein [uncultured Pseudokineococcus sp.]|uniref:hypothetical protein n=1 Tax=uncultured Pseudokineococcus sp. TaxID=1642928 RepID=UPI00260F256C|nr:hypothetical protein [uncultured Pseudokineococcus sp.]